MRRGERDDHRPAPWAPARESQPSRRRSQNPATTRPEQRIEPRRIRRRERDGHRNRLLRREQRRGRRSGARVRVCERNRLQSHRHCNNPNRETVAETQREIKYFFNIIIVWKKDDTKSKPNRRVWELRLRFVAVCLKCAVGWCAHCSFFLVFGDFRFADTWST